MKFLIDSKKQAEKIQQDYQDRLNGDTNVTFRNYQKKMDYPGITDFKRAQYLKSTDYALKPLFHSYKLTPSEEDGYLSMCSPADKNADYTLYWDIKKDIKNLPRVRDWLEVNQ